MNSFADRAIEYFTSLKSPQRLPGGIQITNPFKKTNVRDVIVRFYKKFFDDNNKRVYIIGINPGRFGGGLTGISFTDPVALRESCRIENDLGNQKELSSKFIYKVIEKYGGVKKFHSQYYLTALYPFAILKDGKNYNYYDSSNLYKRLTPAIMGSLKKQAGFGANKKYAVCLGKKNAKYLIKINNELDLFKEIRILDHPRYVMQYRLKLVDSYIDNYLEKFTGS